MTAGAVSRMVKSLKDDMDVRLLDRDGRGIALTQAAQAMAPKLQASFNQMRGVITSLRRISGERALCIAIEPVFASGWLVARLDSFRQIAPSIDIRIDEKIFAVCSPEAINQHGQIKSLDDLTNHTLIHYEYAPQS